MDNKLIFAPYVFGRGFDELRVYDIQRITHMNVAFGLIDHDVVTVDHLDHLDRIATYKLINPALQVILSIGGWEADGFSQAAMTEQGRRTFVDSAMAIVEKWDFDGVDIDWEYPCIDQAPIACDPRDKQNYTYLMQDLRKGLDATSAKTGKKYILTTAVGGEQYYIDNTEMDKVQEVCDYINLMTYDLRSDFTWYAGHHTGLYPQTGDEEGPSCQRTVEIFHKAGVPYEKMVLGSAFYGRKWDGILNDVNRGLGQKASTVGEGNYRFDLLDDEAVAAHGYHRYWDDQAKAPFLYNGSDFISYENEESIKHKCAYIKEMHLAGLMYWAYGESRLFEAVVKHLF